MFQSPEKALCDLIANSPKVNLRYLKDAEIYLEEDIRMELEEFKQMNAEIFEEYMKVGKKALLVYLKNGIPFLLFGR